MACGEEGAAAGSEFKQEAGCGRLALVAGLVLGAVSRLSPSVSATVGVLRRLESEEMPERLAGKGGFKPFLD